MNTIDGDEFDFLDVISDKFKSKLNVNELDDQNHRARISKLVADIANGKMHSEFIQGKTDTGQSYTFLVYRHTEIGFSFVQLRHSSISVTYFFPSNEDKAKFLLFF